LPALGLVAAFLVTRVAVRGAGAGGPLVRTDPRALVAALCLLATLTFGGLLTARYLTWHSFVHDLGSYDQKVWLISTRGDPWTMLEQTWRGSLGVSPCGMIERNWGVCHFQPLHLFLALLYKAWASPLLLLWLQVLAVVSGMIPLFLLARDRLGDTETGFMICLLYLLFPAVQYNALLDFRPDFVAIPFLLWAFFLAGRDRVGLALAVAAGAGLMKESLILAFAGFALFIAFRHRRLGLGLGAFGLGLVVFYLVEFRLLASAGASEGEFILARFFQGDVLLNVVNPRKLVYLGALFGPLGGLPLLAPAALLPAVPALAVSLFSSDVTHASITSQYSASLVGPLFVALLDVLARLRARGERVEPRSVLAGLVTLSAFISLAIGPTPLSMNFWNRAWGGHWHYTQYLPDRQATLNRAERLIPDDPNVAVATQNDLNSARLAHRYGYYSFPNELAWADYVLLDLRRLPFVYWMPEPERYAAFVRGLRASADWRVVFDEEGVLVLQRERR